MLNPILFFIIIIVVDLILKSVKDKKKIQESRPSMPGRQETTHRGELREVLDRELKKQRELSQRKVERKVVENRDRSDRKIIEKRDKTNQEINREYKLKAEENRRKQRGNMTRSNPKMEEKTRVKENQAELDIANNLLMGLIFSEILSEPKAIENQRRSL